MGFARKRVGVEERWPPNHVLEPTTREKYEQEQVVVCGEPLRHQAGDNRVGGKRQEIPVLLEAADRQNSYLCVMGPDIGARGGAHK